MSDVWFDLTDVTLADEDSNSILADNARRAIQVNESMQVMQAMQVMQVMPVMPVMQVMQDMQVVQVKQVIECIQRR